MTNYSTDFQPFDDDSANIRHFELKKKGVVVIIATIAVTFGVAALFGVMPNNNSLLVQSSNQDMIMDQSSCGQPKSFCRGGPANGCCPCTDCVFDGHTGHCI
jgi:hypothetical protein